MIFGIFHLINNMYCRYSSLAGYVPAFALGPERRFLFRPKETLES